MYRQLPLFLVIVIMLSLLLLACGEETATDTHEAIETDAASDQVLPTEGSGMDSDGDFDLSEQSGQYEVYPAMGVRLFRPDGYNNAESYYGFEQVSTQSSVMVILIPGPFSEATRGFTADLLGARGMKLISKEEIKVDGMPGVLAHIAQSAYGTDYLKWLVAFGDENSTRLVTAAFPESLEEEISDLLKAVVLSATPTEVVTPVAGADVGFTITPSDKLKLVAGTGSKVLAYTKDGAFELGEVDDPLFLAAPSTATVPIQDERQYAVDRLFQTANTRVGSITSNNPISIDGLDGYEIFANAEHSDTGVPLKLYQVMLYDGGSYILMQGCVGADVSEEYMPEFEAMAHSLRRTAE